MVYTFARVSAVLGMRVGDYYLQGRRAWFRLHEKGGKLHAVPAHHEAEQYTDEHLQAAGIDPSQRQHASLLIVPRLRPETRADREAPAPARRARNGEAAGATSRAPPLHLQPRASGKRHHGLPGKRRTIEHAQAIAAHESPRTTNSTTGPRMRSP
jgi:integrase/recombinase XerD